MLLTILSILGTLIPTILTNRGIIGASTDTLISSLMGPITTLIANLKAGTSKAQDGLAALGAMQGVVAALQANTGLPAALLSELQDIDKDITAGLVSYVTAEAGLDLSVFKPIAEVS
jgi:hypothetical protein